MQLQQVTTEAKTCHRVRIEQDAESISDSVMSTKRGETLRERYLGFCIFVHQLRGPLIIVSSQIYASGWLMQWFKSGLGYLGIANAAVGRVAMILAILSLGYFFSLEPRQCLRRTAIFLGNLVMGTLVVFLVGTSDKAGQASRSWQGALLFMSIFFVGQIVVSEIFAARWKRQSEAPAKSPMVS